MIVIYNLNINIFILYKGELSDLTKLPFRFL